jgi:hypothetical protein
VAVVAAFAAHVGGAELGARHVAQRDLDSRQRSLQHDAAELLHRPRSVRDSTVNSRSVALDAAGRDLGVLARDGASSTSCTVSL